MELEQCINCINLQAEKALLQNCILKNNIQIFLLNLIFYATAFC